MAAVGSIAAGLIHASAAGNHEGDPVLAWMFALCAMAQMLWGAIALVAIQPTRRVLVVGLVINGGAVFVWALTRALGIPFVPPLSEAEAIGRQDLGAALFAGVSVLASVVVLVRRHRPPRLSFGWVGALAVVALLAALPAMSAEHVHEHVGGEPHGDHEHVEAASGGGHDAHAHNDGSEGAGDHASGHGAAHDGAGPDGHPSAHAHGDSASAGDHDHTGSIGAEDQGHEHAGDPSDRHEHAGDPSDRHEHAGDPSDPHEHAGDPSDDPADPIISLDDPRLTEDQWNIAVALIIGTGSGMAGYTTEADVLGGGYTSLGDGGQPGQYTHYVNWAYVEDEFELDPAHIESIAMKMNADGTTRVVAAMYILSSGKSMSDAPPLAGELTTWHDHDNLCFDGGQFVALASNGVCPIGTLADTPPMLHVWVEANPCGPFAVIDETGADCGAIHTH